MLEEKVINVQGINIFFREGGRMDIPQETRIFIHGWGLSSLAFENMLKQLSKHYHVIGIDLPGFGKSDSLPHFYGYEAYAELIDAFLGQLSLTSVHLLGQSMGGGICLTAGALFPRRIKSLVLVNSAGIPMSQNPSIITRTKELVEQYFASGFVPENKQMLQQFFFNFYNHLPYLSKSVHVPISHDLRPILSKVKVPCLIAWGKKDAMLPVSMGHELCAHLKNAKMIVLENCHHEWSAVFPEKFVTLANSFYSEHKL
ncbi:MAG: alpha/beta hydrolase [bacterium]|nr:alpha/beta hydrolase [bacterium]